MRIRIGLLLCCSGLLAAGDSLLGSNMESVPREKFCVTEGQLSSGKNDWIGVESVKARAVLSFASEQEAEMRFHYLGETQERSRLGSGQERTQLGLKLRAQDGCNLVYVMWRISPETKLVVSIKRNPGKHTHAECGNGGYVNIKAAKERAVPRIEQGSTHSLRANLQGDSLAVYADGEPTWEGKLGSEALQFDGPVGFRSDNVRFDFQFYAPPESARIPCESTRGPE